MNGKFMTGVIVATLLLGATMAFGGPIYVKTAATGAGDGSSWADAMGSIQAAIDLASTSGRSVWVAGGTYDPGNTLFWPSNAKAFGGFHDGDTLFSQRDVAGNPSVITGAGVRRVMNIDGVVNTRVDGFTLTSGTTADWAGGALYMNGLDSSNILINCIIRDSVAPVGHGGGAISNGCTGHIIENCTFENNTCTHMGGGLFIHHSSATVRDCTFTNNESGANWHGGGVAVWESPATTITRSNFIDNRATSGTSGGGLFCGSNGNAAVSQCLFQGNTSEAYGGGVHIENAQPTIVDSIFLNNSATHHGGGAFAGSNNPMTLVFQRCLFQGNSVNGAGGAMGLHGWSGQPVNVTIGGSHFEGNTSQVDAGALDIRNPGVTVTITGTSFVGNQAGLTLPGGQGGAIMNLEQSVLNLVRCGFFGNTTQGGGGGAIFNHVRGVLNATNCVFDNNHAPWIGGGIAVWGSTATINHCTFNRNGNGAHVAHDLWVDNSPAAASATANNCIFWGPHGASQVGQNAAGLLTINYSDVKYGWAGTGNINTDPLFVDGTDGNCRLQAGSPCRDTADPASALTVDIYNNTRPGTGAGVRRDMGAYEWNNTTPSVVSITPRTGETNPTKSRYAVFTVTLDEGVGGQAYDLLNGFTPGHFSLTTTGSISGASVLRVTGNATARTVLVDTGTGSGTIRLDLSTTAGLACSGNLGLANVPFTSGAVYTIDKAPPRINAISRADGNPNGSASVDFSVTFTEAVSTVALTDFDLLTTGGISGAAITGLSGSGANYTVSVSTGTGEGTIGIRAGNGAGTFDGVGNMHDNWIFDSAVYTIDKTPPTVLSITRRIPPGMDTNAASVTWRVTFSEDVTGTVDTSDFTLTKINGADPITGFSVTNVAPVTGLIYDVMCNTGTGDGRIRLDVLVPSADIRDLANNPLTASYTSGEVYAIDKTPPALVISAPSASVTTGGPVSYTVTYSDGGSGLNAITLAAGNVTVDATGSAAAGSVVVGAGATTEQRTVTLSGITGDGTLDISIAAGTATDNAGNGALAQGPSDTFIVDNTPPSVNIGAPSHPITNTGPVTFTVSYEDAGSGLAAITLVQGNVTLNSTGDAAATVGISGTGDTRTVTLSSITGDGTLGISIAAGTATDNAGHSAPGAGPSATFVVDNTQPTATLDSAGSVPEPTVLSSIPMTVAFDESVTGFTAGDIALVNATVANFSGTGANYSFDLLPSGSGVFSAQVPGAVAVDAASNGNLASAVFQRTYDGADLIVSLASVAADPTSVAPIPVTVTFNRSVTGFDASDISVTNADVEDFAGTGALYTFNLAPQAQGAATAQVPAGAATDGVNLNLESNLFARVYDSIRPTLALASLAPSPTNAAIPVTATFSEPVWGFTALDVTVSNATVDDFTGGDGDEAFTFTLTPTVAGGTVTASVAAGAAADEAGNLSEAAPDDIVRVYDSVQPTVALESLAPDPTNAAIPVTATFSEAVYGFVAGDLTVTNADVTDWIGDDGDAVFTFTLTPTVTVGTITASLAASAATDAAGNPSEAAPNDVVRDYDGVAPTVALTSVAPNPTNVAIPVTATFSEPVFGFSDAGVTVNNATVTDWVGVDGDTVYTFTLTPTDTEGMITALLAAGVAADAAANDNTESNLLSRDYDGLPPTAVCRNFLAELDVNGEVVVMPIDIDNGSNDNVGITAWFIDGGAELTYTCADIAASPHTVTLRVEDAFGHFDECTAEVTVADNMAPVINIPGANPRYLPAGSMFTMPNVTAVDNCDGAVTVTLLSDDSIAVAPNPVMEGVYELVYQAVDSNGNIANETLTVNVASPAPIIVEIVGEREFVRSVGESVTFEVSASGGLGDLNYQWYRIVPDKSMNQIIGAESADYTINPVGVDHAGEYVCLVFDLATSTMSDPPFTLEVTDTPVPALGAFGLALVAALSAVAGALSLRKKQ